MLQELAQNKVENLGFYKFDFLSKEKIYKLKELYSKLFEQIQNKGMAVSHNQGGWHRNYEISNSIEEILKDELQEHFPNYDFFLAHFVIKKANHDEGFQLHQDWNIVDESKCNSYQIWVPLEYSYPENGGMCFLPKSHLFLKNLRSGSFDIPRIPIDSKLYPFLSYVRLFSGQAVAFSNSLFHGSFSNCSPEDRVSILINVVPKSEQTFYYHDDGKGNAEVFSINAELLFKNLPVLEKGEMPFHNPIEVINKIYQRKNAEIGLSDLIKWSKEIRKELDLPEDYEFKDMQIVKNTSLEKEINSNGYSVIKLLTDAEIEKIFTLFSEHFPKREQYIGRYSSMDHKDSKERLLIHEKIQAIVRHRLDLFFKDYFCPISILYSKRADGISDTGWHSDPNFLLNQHLEPLYSIWCPIVPVNQENGVLNVIPKSHRFLNNLRHPCLDWPLAKEIKALDKLGKGFDLRAGEAIIYDARLIHGSPPNISMSERDCIVMRINPIGLTYYSMGLINKEKTQGVIYSEKEDYFYSDACINHAAESTTGNVEGKVYYFQEILGKELIQTLTF